LYEDFLQTNPNDTWALNNLGSHLMGQGEYHRALLRLKKAARIDSSDKVVAKNIRKAERELKKILSLPA
jgi:Tfp pilus assembly protein PilF